MFFGDEFPALGYESREGQEDMALDIAEAMKGKQHILIEAGVGIGKSYAYLVPVLIYNKYFKKPVVVSTSSIALQEQLKEDISKISKHIRCYPEVVLAKGRSHFACRSRAIDYLTTNSKKIKNYKELIKNIEDGKIDRSKLPLKISNNEWRGISVDSCNLNACDCKLECEYLKYRKDMRLTSGIILTNHDMLTVNMDKKKNRERELFDSRFEFIVMDEAHNLEDKVRSNLTKKWSIIIIKRSFSIIKGAMRNNYGNYEEELSSLIGKIEGLFKKFNLEVDKQIIENDLEEKDMYDLDFKDMWKHISDVSELLDDYLFELSIHGNLRGERQDEAYNELYLFNEVIGSLDNTDYNRLYWLSRRGKGANNVYLETCPKEVSNHIKKLYFDNSSIKTILTSATITHLKSDNPKKSYSYFTRNTGFPIDESKGFLSEPKDSPYPYDKHSIIYTCDHLPLPREEAFMGKGVEEIVKLLNITNGKTMILFTSKKDMEEVYANLKKMRLSWDILKQDSSSSQSETLDSFKVNTNSVLLGTGAFWEGISVEGEALSNVVIFRLPFPVPDPIIKYKCQTAKDDMMEVLLPHMIIKLKQGIGRLIRNDTDKGIITILDPRLGERANNDYRHIVWDALPIKSRTNKLSEVTDFYNGVCKSSIETKEDNVS